MTGHTSHRRAARVWSRMSVEAKRVGSVTHARARPTVAVVRELQSFVLVETGHMPTVGAVAALRTRIRKALLPPGSGDTP